MRIQCRTKKGGCVRLNMKHGVWASYAVASVADFPPPEILYAGVTLPNGRQIQFFANRESGLIVVDIVAPNSRCGNEVLRLNANAVGLPSERACAAGRGEKCLSTG